MVRSLLSHFEEFIFCLGGEPLKNLKWIRNTFLTGNFDDCVEKDGLEKVQYRQESSGSPTSGK